MNTTIDTPYGRVDTYGDCQLNKFCVGKPVHRFYLYACLLMAGASNQAEPMLSIDPLIRVDLNKRGYFPGSLLEAWPKQQHVVAEAIAERRAGTLLFASQYHLQESKARPRLWSLSFKVDLKTKKLNAQAVFGYCTTWGLLPYEMFGIACMCYLMSKQVGKEFGTLLTFYHELNVPKFTLAEATEAVAPFVLPTIGEAAQLLAIERSMRYNAQVRPTSDIPLSAFQSQVIDALQLQYMETQRA